jgi:hypothetical protein
MKRKQELFSALPALLAVGVAVAPLITTFRGALEDKEFLYVVPIFFAALAAVSSLYLLRSKERLRRKKRVFIIYSDYDFDAASELAIRLRSAGFNPWLDVDQIVPGQRIDEASQSALAQSAIALLLISKNLEGSPKYVHDQLQYALSSMRSKNELYSPVIPVQLDDSPGPKELHGVRGVDLSSGDDENFDLLVRGLQVALEM